MSTISSPKTWVVYLIWSPNTDLVYIGSSMNMCARWDKHDGDFEPSASIIVFYYGNADYTILVDGLTSKRDALLAEQLQIDLRPTNVNCARACALHLYDKERAISLTCCGVNHSIHCCCAKDVYEKKIIRSVMDELLETVILFDDLRKIMDVCYWPL